MLGKRGATFWVGFASFFLPDALSAHAMSVPKLMGVGHVSGSDRSWKLTLRVGVPQKENKESETVTLFTQLKSNSEVGSTL